MGLESRKRSGNYIGGSRLIVTGQNIYNVKKFQLTFDKKITTKETISITTTTTTIPITI